MFMLGLKVQVTAHRNKQPSFLTLLHINNTFNDWHNRGSALCPKFQFSVYSFHYNHVDFLLVLIPGFANY